MDWRHGHPNGRHVQCANGAGERNYKHCQSFGRPPCYLGARTRRERLSGLADLGADQCDVPGCDWRYNANPNTHSDYHSHGYSHSDGNGHCHGNNDSDCDCYSYSHRFRQSDTDTQTNADS